MKKILIVEDSAIIAMHLKILFEENGFEVIGRCTNAADAVRLTSELLPDLILMDVMLEGIATGIDAIHEIRKSNPVPVIFMSALTDAKSLSAMASFSNAKLSGKPFNELEVLALTRELLQHSHTDSKVQ